MSQLKVFIVDGLKVTIRKSAVKKISLRVRRGEVMVVQPRWLSYRSGLEFTESNRDWIRRHMDKVQMSEWLPETADYKKDKEKSRDLVYAKLDYWNQFYQYDFGQVAIRDQSTRWGSCSSQGNLNFNWKILYLPDDLADYLIVHELCHLKEQNHSADFWGLVSKTIGNYKIKRKNLRQLSL